MSIIKFSIFVIVLISVFCFDLFQGSQIDNPFKYLMNLIHNSKNDLDWIILCQIRLPRAIMAVVAGFNLSLAGFIFQGLTNNVLADPYLIGVASGSALFSVLAIIWQLPIWQLPLLALVGGIITSIIIILFSQKNNLINTNNLLIVGFGVSSVCSGLINILVSCNSSKLNLNNILSYLYGSLSNIQIRDLYVPSLVCLVSLCLVLAWSKPFKILNLGVMEATNVGVDVVFYQLALSFIAILLCASITAYCGIIAFVGLVPAFIGRSIFFGNDKIQILFTAIFGAILMIVSDILCRTLVTNVELPISSILSLIGTPILIFLLLKNSK